MTLYLGFGWKRNAGLICVAWRGFSLHFGVNREQWVFGYKEDWYDGSLPMIGAGPLFLFSWVYSLRESLRGDQ